MEHDSEFEDLEFEFSKDGRDYHCNLYGNATWDIQNDTFDYAGTHCTHGQAGTCHLPDYAVIENISLGAVDLYFEVYDEYTKRHGEAGIKFIWKREKDRDFITEFEKEHSCLIEEALQEQEDDNGNVIQTIKDLAEESKYEGRL